MKKLGKKKEIRSLLIYLGVIATSLPYLFILYIVSAMAIGIVPTSSWGLYEIILIGIFIIGISLPIVVGYVVNGFIQKDFKSSMRLFLIVLVVYHIVLAVII